MTAVCYEDTPFGQARTDWDKIQEVKEARVGDGVIKELAIPEHIWGKSRRDTVHNTYRDLFHKENFMIGQFISAIVNDEQASPNLDDGLRIQRLVEAAVQSHKTSQRVDIESIH